MPEIIDVDPVSASAEKTTKGNNKPSETQRKIGIANLIIATASFALVVYYVVLQLNGERNLNMIIALSIYTVTNCWFGLNRRNANHFTIDTCMFIATFVALGIIIFECLF